ncbi:MAG: TIM barrel protein [Alphaproteobacteria bacterium]
MTDALISRFGATHGPVAGDLDALARALEAIAAAGGDVAELYPSALSIAAAGRPIPERVRAVQAHAAAAGVGLTLHAPIPINFMDRAHADLHWRAGLLSLELAAMLAAPVVVFHAGRCHPTAWAREAEALLAFEREALSRLGDAAAARGVKAAIENISPNPAVIAGGETSYSLEPAALARQLAEIAHPSVAGCLDLSHALQGATLTGTDYLAGVRAMGPWTDHIHVSDVTGASAPAFVEDAGDRIFFGVGDMHAPIGWGGIDFENVAAEFRPRPRSTVILELAGPARFALGESLEKVRALAAAIG